MAGRVPVDRDEREWRDRHCSVHSRHMAFVHVVLDGVADGALGVGLDVLAAAARIVDAGLVAHPRSSAPFAQRVLNWR
jgi:hypothetical protein